MEGIQIYRVPYFYPTRLQRLAYVGGGILANIRRGWLARVQVPLLFFTTVWAIVRYQERVDLIHCHWLPTAVAALMARPFSRTVEGCISTGRRDDEHCMPGRTKFRRIMAPWMKNGLCDW
jgi:hypothetical protein